MIYKNVLDNSGLSERDQNLILSVLADELKIIRAWLFGSRAKGTFSTTSDIDIAVEGLVDTIQIESLMEKLNDLPFPYFVDVVGIELISNLELKNNILKHGILILDKFNCTM